MKIQLKIFTVQSHILQYSDITRSDDIIAECMDMFKCLPVADVVFRLKEIFCHSSASVITFYVISAVLLRQLSFNYGRYITF